MVAAGIADQILVQLSYAIGIAHPLSIYVDTYGTARVSDTDAEIARRIERLFDLRPASIVERFGLKNPIFEATASYGHFGNRHGREVTKEIEFFGWEKLDEVENLRREFGIL